MISPRKLIKMARKWQKVAAMRRKRISFPETNGSEERPSSSSRASDVARKGHFIVYSVDQKRFEFPMSYLNNHIIRELFEMSEEEFGLPGAGPIVLPCDATLMENVVLLIKGTRKDKDLQRDLLSRCSVSHSNQHRHVEHGMLVCT